MGRGVGPWSLRPKSEPVGVSTVIYVEYVDGSGVVVDAVADAILATACPPMTRERPTEGCANM